MVKDQFLPVCIKTLCINVNKNCENIGKRIIQELTLVADHWVLSDASLKASGLLKPFNNLSENNLLLKNYVTSKRADITMFFTTNSSPLLLVTK